MRFSSLIAAAFSAGIAAAQSQQQNNYPYTIDPNSVPKSDRQTWCDNQRAQCPLICLQQPGVTSMTTQDNDCDPDALTYSCVCDNGVAPNITQYSQTLPFYICQAWGNQCVDRCGGANSCEADCRQNHPCGAQNPYKGNSTLASLTSALASATSKIPVTGFGGATGSAQSKGAAAAVHVPGQLFGAGVLGAVAVLGFAVFL